MYNDAMRTRATVAIRAIRLILAVVLIAGPWVIVGPTGCSKPRPAVLNATEIQEFQNAMNDGDAAIVDRLLSAKPGLVNVRDAQGRTPLQQARERDDAELIQVIERHGGKE